MSDTVYKILFEGSLFPGSDSGAMFRALPRLGHRALSIDPEEHLPRTWHSFSLRALRKLATPMIVDEYNQKVLQLARDFSPEIFLSFKGAMLKRETIVALREMGIVAYNFYPDLSAFTHAGDSLPRALSAFDCVFSTKSFMRDDLLKRGYKLNNFHFIPHGYDPEIHKPLDPWPEDILNYGADVVFLGVYSPRKERLLGDLISAMPDLRVLIWGGSWFKASNEAVRACAKGRPIYGLEYTLGLCSAKIALGFLSERVLGASRGDQITSRTFNIPATGTFVIHQRTDEVLQYYREGEEIECFSDSGELTDKVRYYLDLPEERERIARAGYRRAVPAYSIDERVKQILEWHRSNAGKP